MSGKRKRVQLKNTSEKQVKEETENIGWEKEDALNQTKWKSEVEVIAEGMG